MYSYTAFRKVAEALILSQTLNLSKLTGMSVLNHLHYIKTNYLYPFFICTCKIFGIFTSMAISYSYPMTPLLHFFVASNNLTMFILFTYFNYDINRKALVMDFTQVHNLCDYIEYCTYIQLDMLNIPSVRKRTPLLIAVEHNNIEFVRHIILLGGNVDIVSGGENLSPLCQAIKGNCNAIACVLIDSGANLNNCQYLLPILMAVMYNTSMIEPLIQAGANVGLECGPIEATPLMYAIRIENIEAIQLLVEHGADVNKCCGVLKKCPLMKAVMMDHIGIVQTLLQNGANPNVVNITSLRQNTTPLISCIQNTNFDMMMLLIQHGADVNQSNQHGSTPLSCLVGLMSQLFNGIHRDSLLGIIPQSDQSNQALPVNDESIYRCMMYKRMLKFLIDAGLKKHIVDKKQLICCSIYCPSFVNILKEYRGKDWFAFSMVRNHAPFQALDNNCVETIGGFLSSSLSNDIVDSLSVVSSLLIP